MAALENVEQQINDDLRNRYRLAVTVLMDGNKKATQDKSFQEQFLEVKQKYNSSQLAVAFTIAVLEKCGWRDTESLKPFTSEGQGYSLEPHVAECLELYEEYNKMDDQKFRDAKSSIAMIVKDDISGLNEFDLVLLMLREGFISVDNEVDFEEHKDSELLLATV